MMKVESMQVPRGMVLTTWRKKYLRYTCGLHYTAEANHKNTTTISKYSRYKSVLDTASRK
jgi:hypothetical protein